MDISTEKIVITGASGFVGKHTLSAFKRDGATNVIPIRHDEYELTCNDDVQRMYDHHEPVIVVYLAAKVGGIGFNREFPADLFY